MCGAGDPRAGRGRDRAGQGPLQLNDTFLVIEDVAAMVARSVHNRRTSSTSRSVLSLILISQKFDKINDFAVGVGVCLTDSTQLPKQRTEPRLFVTLCDCSDG